MGNVNKRELWVAVLLLTVLICAAFTAVASFLVWVLFVGFGIEEEPGFLVRLAIKGLLFAGVACLAALGLRRVAPCLDACDVPLRTPPGSSWTNRVGLAVVLAGAAVFVGTNLDSYPTVLPDEAHHLIVARNLAVHGVYGSGHPDSGFVWFDPYDSVGPPVVGLVAAAFRVGGVGLTAGRLVMAAYFVGLCLVVYFFCKPVFGAAASVLGTAALSMAWGSVYLGRSVYGEVPALMFLLAALMLWRVALADKRPILCGTIAGAFFSGAILSKYFIILVLWGFIGCIVYDRLTFRRIYWRHVLPAAAGAVAVPALWWTVQGALNPGSAGGAWALVSMYRHNLLFGLRSMDAPLRWLFDYPQATFVLLGALAMMWLLPEVFRRKYDPPAVVVFLFVPFLTYWWVAFTPGNIPRYLWYALALGSMFTGVAALQFLEQARQAGASTRMRVLCAVVACGLLLPTARHTVWEATCVLRRDDMRDDRALAEYVRALPKDSRVASSYWPVPRLLNFLADRHVHRVAATPEGRIGYDAVIIDKKTQADVLDGSLPAEVIGRYAILLSKE